MNNYEERAKKLLGKGNNQRAWLKTFYPIRASLLVDRPGATAEDLVQHSITKWLGLQEFILEQCGLAMWNGGLYSKSNFDGEIIHVSSESCTLCWKYSDSQDPEEKRCRNCPIFLERGGRKCYDLVPSEERSPWAVWTSERNPIPMLGALEKALAYVQNHPDQF